MTQRFEGHSLEEALTAASETLGVDRYQIAHRVLEEKRGFLGGIKRVVIEAEINENAAAAIVKAADADGNRIASATCSRATSRSSPARSRSKGRSRRARRWFTRGASRSSRSRS